MKNKIYSKNWIFVNERLPKGCEIVLLLLPPRIGDDDKKCGESIICGHYIGGKDDEWGISDGETFGYGLVSARYNTSPIAWQPLPPIYDDNE